MYLRYPDDVDNASIAIRTYFLCIHGFQITRMVFIWCPDKVNVMKMMWYDEIIAYYIDKFKMFI